MEKLKVLLIAIVTLIIGALFMSEAEAKLQLTSKAIQNGKKIDIEQVYNGYGCAGKNISPDLQWSNPPKGTKSFALIVHDPDAPVEGGWYHWLVFNIPSIKKSLLKGEILPYPMFQTATSFDVPGYGGPCPPVGHNRHRYIFTLYALDVPRLPLHEDFKPQYAEKIMLPHVIGQASITGYYQR